MGNATLRNQHRTVANFPYTLIFAFLRQAKPFQTDAGCQAMSGFLYSAFCRCALATSIATTEARPGFLYRSVVPTGPFVQHADLPAKSVEDTEREHLWF